MFRCIFLGVTVVVEIRRKEKTLDLGKWVGGCDPRGVYGMTNLVDNGV